MKPLNLNSVRAYAIPLTAAFLMFGTGAPSGAGTWPLDPAVCTEGCYVTQGYKEKDLDYHTGIDLKVPRDNVPVRAIVDGFVVATQRNGERINDAKPCVPKNKRKKGEENNCADFGYGNSIIIENKFQKGVFIQYSHLRDEPTLSKGTPVGAGAEIGIVGGTGYGDPKHYVRHLHFEVKDFSELRSKKYPFPQCAYGYSEKDPGKCGYSDPVQQIYTVVADVGMVQVTTSGLAIRSVPGPFLKRDVRIRTVAKGEKFEVIAKIDRKILNCSEDWLKIRPLQDPWFTYNEKPSLGGDTITIEQAWICRGNNGETWVKEIEKEVGEGPRITTGGLATALVIDRSGSMQGEKLRKAKAGAGVYVKLMEPADYTSVSSFSQGARTDMPMSPQPEARKNIDTILGTVDSTGSTNIGAGLGQGYLELEGLGRTARKVALLLSDGQHNVGSFETAVQPIVDKFASYRPRWRIYTIGYGSGADSKTLYNRISLPTDGRYWHADTVDIEDVYCQINFDIYNKASTLSVSDTLPPGGQVTHAVYVAPGAESLTLCTSWQGSKLETVLISPTGIILDKNRLTGRIGRYDEGETYQLLQVHKPSPGRWQVRVRWLEPPSTAEQVNITVGEKSDLFAQILGLKSEYQPGEPVTLNVEIGEVVGYERVPLRDARLRVQVQKPGGPEMVRLVQARPVNLAMAKRTIQGATRNIRLYDDGAHQDYRAGDGIFGGTFTETDENGAYLVTATVTGHKRNGQRVQRKLIASFQVGPISQNPVTTAQVLEVRDLLEGRTDPAEAIKALRSDPLAAIKGSQSDPLDAINKLRQGVQ